MRKHLILFFSALFLLAACKDDQHADNVIPKDKMIKVLADVHITDGSLMLYGPNDSLYKYGTNRYIQVFKKHGIDSATFNRSVKYYAMRPDDMIEIYDSLTKLLNTKSDSVTKIQAKINEKEAKALEAKGKKRLDSLKRDSIKAAKAIKLKTNKKVI